MINQSISDYFNPSYEKPRSHFPSFDCRNEKTLTLDRKRDIWIQCDWYDCVRLRQAPLQREKDGERDSSCFNTQFHLAYLSNFLKNYFISKTKKNKGIFRDVCFPFREICPLCVLPRVGLMYVHLLPRLSKLFFSLVRGFYLSIVLFYENPHAITFEILMVISIYQNFFSFNQNSLQPIKLKIYLGVLYSLIFIF